MKTLRLLCAVLLLSGLAAAATTLQGTVTDPNGNPFASGTVSFVTAPNTGSAQTTTTSTTNAVGFFSQSLTSSTGYTVTVCANPYSLGYTVDPARISTCTSAVITTAASGTQDVSATLLAAAPNMGLPYGAVIQSYIATAALTAGQVVKMDTGNANSVVVATTSDTGGGIAIGIVLNSPGAGGTARVMTSGLTAAPLLGTSTCTVGQYVIVDTSTNGDVKCSTYTAGTSLGLALQAQSSTGKPVAMLVQIR